MTVILDAFSWPVHYQMCQYERFLICSESNHSVFAESALIINALPPKFLQKRFPLLFHGAFVGMRGWGSWGGGSTAAEDT